MLFNSLEYIVFLPIVFLLYWFIKHVTKNDSQQIKLQNWFIIIVSYFFYACWDARFLVLILITTCCSYYSGLLINNATKECYKKFYLICNVVVNLLILGICKYYDFFVQSFAELFDINTESLLLNIVLPVGISFYTFQALSYSIDVYRKRLCATREFAAFGAYISFFPQLVAGPIERAENLLPQFLDKRDFDYQQAVYGLRLMLWGFFKKIVIADNCGIYVDSVWNDYTSQSSATLLLAALLFSMQIYADFSGYSDIAIGTARLFGIRLSDNFNSPYFAQNIADFWRRWHISLTSWFRNYVYIPLGGNRKGKWQTIINTLIVFSLCGLWHGANWTFVVWGIYNALLFVPMIWLRSHKKAYASTERREWYKVIATFVLVALGWIVFRAPSMEECVGYIQALCRCDFSSIWIENIFQMICLVMAIVVLLVFEWKKYLPNRWWVYYVLLFFIWWFAGQDVDFIYFQF